MMALVLTLLSAAPAPALDEAVRAEVRELVGDLAGEIVVHEVRVGDARLTRGDYVVEIGKTAPKTDRPVRVRGKVHAGDRSTWLSATIEIRGSAEATSTTLRPTGPVLVNRGDRVMARVSDRYFRVSAEAEALSPARQNERVTVRVVSSGKTLEGRVASPGVVEIGAEVGP